MSSGRTRDDRGVALPSPVVALSALAIVMAVVAFFLTNGGGEPEREITPAADASTTPSASPSASPSTEAKQPKKKPEKKKPVVDRGATYVEVYNNTNITGLAGEVGDRAATVGWNVVGVDDWMGTIPANTVYYPARLEAAGKQLALDLGITRVRPAVPDSMKEDRLTLILVSAP